MRPAGHSRRPGGAVHPVAASDCCLDRGDYTGATTATDGHPTRGRQGECGERSRAERRPRRPGGQPYDYYAYRFAAERQGLQDALLREVYDDYCGQTSWTPTALYDRYFRWIDVAPGTCVLDVACGAGGPALRLARGAGCAVVGIDLNAQAIATATTLADEEGLGNRVRFVCHDATQPLPFPDQTFDAVVCVDALVGLPDRPRLLAEWARVLKPGGPLVFTDPVLAGPLSNAELAARPPSSCAGPAGLPERLLGEAGFELLRREDVTADLAEIARRHREARAAHAEALQALEGDAVFVEPEPIPRDGRAAGPRAPPLARRVPRPQAGLNRPARAKRRGGHRSAHQCQPPDEDAGNRRSCVPSSRRLRRAR